MLSATTLCLWDLCTTIEGFCRNEISTGTARDHRPFSKYIRTTVPRTTREIHYVDVRDSRVRSNVLIPGFKSVTRIRTHPRTEVPFSRTFLGVNFPRSRFFQTRRAAICVKHFAGLRGVIIPLCVACLVHAGLNCEESHSVYRLYRVMCSISYGKSLL